WWFLSAVGLRDLALLVFAGFVIRDVLRPDLDVVRADGEDDPAGGVLSGAPDRVRVKEQDASEKSGHDDQGVTAVAPREKGRAGAAG
ncbi:MAG: hypothetical protein M3486_08440, partial [Actinomycetota bacterium]|nr:hypothetical protein [Actinomycetota bacterium]